MNYKGSDGDLSYRLKTSTEGLVLLGGFIRTSTR